MSDRTSAVAVALIAVAVYLPALWNGWAGDDLVVIPTNPAVKSVGSALAGWFAPYWPGDMISMGLHRPVTILTYAVDWSLSGGSPWWFHLVNVALHAASCVLVFWVARAWLATGAATVASILFAIHPVHVEAVANVVGRAELLAAVGLLGAILAARRMRAADSSWGAVRWGSLVVALTALALLSKEHAVVALGVLVADHLFAPNDRRDEALRRSMRCYLAVAALTAAWLFVWRGVVGRYVDTGAHEALVGLSVAERITTMLPASLEVLRLMAWPMRLASDYAPWVTPIRLEWSWPATIALITLSAMAGIVVLGYRRWPAVGAGVVVGALSLLPTSNVFFVSGVILAERTMYLAVLAPALVAGVVWSATGGAARRPMAIVAIAYAALITGVVLQRTPDWRGQISLLAQARYALPTSYRVRQRLAAFYEESGDSVRAFDERLAAYELFPEHPQAGVYVAELAHAMGRYEVALGYLAINRETRPDDPAILRLVVLSLAGLGQHDSALAEARRAIDRLPASVVMLGVYLEVLDATEAPEWMRTLARTQATALQGDFIRATLTVAEAVGALPTVLDGEAGACWELRRALVLLQAIRPAELARARQHLAGWGCLDSG